MEQKTKHPHGGHRQRFKTKALKGGIEHWPYHEVLELMLMYLIPQKDVNPLAHKLIDTFGSFSRVMDVGYEQLCKVNGVGESTALFLSMFPEFVRKYEASKNVGPILLDTTVKCVNLFRSVAKMGEHEEFFVFCLDGKKNLLKTVSLGKGEPSAINIQVAELAHQVVFKENKSIVIMHTHPNRGADPTVADYEATKRFMQMAASLGLVFDDHIIVSKNEFFSFRNSDYYERMLIELKEKMN